MLVAETRWKFKIPPCHILGDWPGGFATAIPDGAIFFKRACLPAGHFGVERGRRPESGFGRHGLELMVSHPCVAFWTFSSRPPLPSSRSGPSTKAAVSPANATGYG